MQQPTVLAYGPDLGRTEQATVRRYTWVMALVWSTLCVAAMIGSLIADPLVRSPALPLSQGLLWLSGMATIILVGYGLARWAASRRLFGEGFATADSHYRRLLEAAHAGIGVFDPAGKVLGLNQVLADMVGCPAEELLGRPAADLFDPDDRPVLPDPKAPGLQGHPGPNFSRIRQRSGQTVHVLVWLSPVLDKRGRHRATLCLVLDVSSLPAGPFASLPHAHSPLEILAEAVDFVYDLAETRPVSLQVQLVGPMPRTIRTNAPVLRRLLVLLMSRAIRLAGSGAVRLVGEVIGRPTPQPTLRLNLFYAGSGSSEQHDAEIPSPADPSGPACPSSAVSPHQSGVLRDVVPLAQRLGGSGTVMHEPGLGTYCEVLLPLDVPANTIWIERPVEAWKAATGQHLQVLPSGVDPSFRASVDAGGDRHFPRAGMATDWLG